MTHVVLDTNAYLRLAKRVRPLLGIPFGDKQYVLITLKDVEDEVRRNPALLFKFPWFDDQVLAEERLATRIRLSKEEKEGIDVAKSVFYQSVVIDAMRFVTGGGNSPPSQVDCYVLAYAHVRRCIVATDDKSMHMLAKEFGVKVWHGHQLLKMLQSAGKATTDLIKEIYEALETNNDLPATWRAAKHTKFQKIFGKSPRDPR